MLFVEEYLQDLRNERFAPRALVLYLRRVAARSRDAMVANPGAVRSVWLVGLLFFVGAYLASVQIALRYDRHLAYDFLLQTSLWILPAFAFVSLNVDHLRDRQGFALSGLNVPTILTLLRVVLVPGIALFLLERHFTLALVTFLVAALSDVADGWLARRLKQETRLGTALDPVVDIVFNLAMFFALMAAHLLPPWAFAMAALRYGMLLIGGAGLYLFVGPLRIRPTAFGRATGVVMASLVALLLWLHAMNDRVSQRLVPLTEAALGVLLLATVIQVVAMGWYNLKLLRGEARARGQVVGDVRWGAR
jgi:cardiolipin synthase